MHNADKLSQHAVTQSQAREARHAIPACIMQTSYPSIGSADKLSQHAVTQSQAREARHAIPAMHNADMLSQQAVTQPQPQNLDMLSQACIVQTSYPSMQLPNHRPGKPDMLFQHAVA